MSVFLDEMFSINDFTDTLVKNKKFYGCDFSKCNLTDTRFINCLFYDDDRQIGCDFSGALLKDASFSQCDLTMNNFKSIDGIGIEITNCKALGANFHSASFMNKISTKIWFCSACITGNDLSYTNFTNVILEKCELWENRWNNASVKTSNFSGSDLSGGDFTNFDWKSLNVTYCNLSNSNLGDLDLRRTSLEGVILDSEQINILVSNIGVIISD